MESLIKLQDSIIFEIPLEGRFNAKLDGNTYCLNMKAKEIIKFDEIKVFNRQGSHIDTMKKSGYVNKGDLLSIRYSVHVEIC